MTESSQKTQKTASVADVWPDYVLIAFNAHVRHPWATQVAEDDALRIAEQMLEQRDRFQWMMVTFDTAHQPGGSDDENAVNLLVSDEQPLETIREAAAAGRVVRINFDSGY